LFKPENPSDREASRHDGSIFFICFIQQILKQFVPQTIGRIFCICFIPKIQKPILNQRKTTIMI
jgi:hypothetical protein